MTVLNSHTHFDHVGGNREFTDVRNLDLPFSQRERPGRRGGGAARIRAATRSRRTASAGPLPEGATSRDVLDAGLDGSRHSSSDGDRLELGGRTLEILATPGHTPDSIFPARQRERAPVHRRYLLRGARSVLGAGDGRARESRRIDREAGAALVPGLKRLFPAHGPPVADPAGCSSDFQKALADIEAGRVPFETTRTGRRLYKFEHFSILMKEPG